MDFWRTVVVLFRRWYIAIPAFFLTLGIAGAAYSVVPVQYQSGAVLVLTTPLSGGTEAVDAKHPNPVTNPMMNFDQSLALAASIVIQQLNSSQTTVLLGITPGGTTSYEVSNGSTNPELLESGPFIFIQGNGTSPRAAQQIAEQVSALAAKDLAERQTEAGAPPITHIGMQTIVSPPAGQPLKSSRMRAAAATGALAALASLAGVYCFENLMTHRRRRRVRKDAALANPVAQFSALTDPTESGGPAVSDARAARSTDVESRVVPRGSAPAASDHSVDSRSIGRVATGAVGVLEGPADGAAVSPGYGQRRWLRRRKRVSSRTPTADAPAPPVKDAR